MSEETSIESNYEPPLELPIVGQYFSDQNLAAILGPGDECALRREAENPYDSNAVAVYGAYPSGELAQIGYIAKDDAQYLGPSMDARSLSLIKATLTSNGSKSCIMTWPRWKVRHPESCIPSEETFAVKEDAISYCTLRGWSPEECLIDPNEVEAGA